MFISFMYTINMNHPSRVDLTLADWYKTNLRREPINGLGNILKTHSISVYWLCQYFEEEEIRLPKEALYKLASKKPKKVDLTHVRRIRAAINDLFDVLYTFEEILGEITDRPATNYLD